MSNEVGQRNLNIVEVMLENGHRGNWDVVKPYVSDDVILHVPLSLPFGGEYRGWQGYMDVLKNIGAFFTDLKGGPREFATVGNKVIVIGSLSGRIAKNGRPISFPLTDVWTLEDGKLTEVTAFYYDTHAIAAAADS